MPYRFLDHTADVAVEVWGADEGELFREAGRALTAIYVDAEGGAAVERSVERDLRLEADDGESLLIGFLNELIYLFDTEKFLCASASVAEVTTGSPARLRARLAGETFDPRRHLFLTEVKAATFHGVEIREREDGVCATVVFDL
jgi:SHS2 domain-containing protein